MDAFWIPCLAILALLHQTSMYEKSSIRGRPIMAAPANASDTTEVIGVLGEPVTFCVSSTDENPAIWYFEGKAIVTAPFKDPSNVAFHKDEYTPYFAVSENGRALTISQPRMEDAGTYSVKINGKASTFTLQVFRKLAKPTVTCEAQNCSDGSCSSSLRCFAPGPDFRNISYTWWVGDQLWAEGPILLVNESLLGMLALLTCVAENPVSSRNATVTDLGELCAAITTHPPSPGAPSGGWISIISVVVVLLLLIFLMVYCIYKAKKKRQRGSTGSQDDSDGAAGGPGDGQQDTVQEVCLMDEINPLVLSNTPETVDKA